MCCRGVSGATAAAWSLSVITTRRSTTQDWCPRTCNCGGADWRRGSCIPWLRVLYGHVGSDAGLGCAEFRRSASERSPRRCGSACALKSCASVTHWSARSLGWATACPSSAAAPSIKRHAHAVSEAACSVRCPLHAPSSPPLCVGAVVDVQALADLGKRLAKGGWVHIFAEGRVWQEVRPTSGACRIHRGQRPGQ